MQETLFWGPKMYEEGRGIFSSGLLRNVVRESVVGT